MSALLISVAGFSQKNELKEADKALDKGDIAAAQTALTSAEPLIANAEDKLQAQYYFLNGKLLAEQGKKGDASAFEKAAKSFKKVLEMEKNGTKTKYTSETEQRIQALVADLVNSAVEDNGKQDFKSAAEKLYTSYTLSPKDTSYLYFAAGSAVNGGEYDQALGYYQKLTEIGYDGGGIRYTAVNAESGETEEMGKSQRDLYVKSGQYKDPKDEKIPSKKAEIVKNMALIYSELGQDDKAKEAFKEARANNPKDVNLILSEANLYYKLGDKDKFKELMSEATDLAPDNADLHYNIGVISMEQGDIEGAREAFKKALAIDPGYVNARLNLSTSYVNEGNSLIDEMNNLGNSKADIARYDELKEKKDSLFLEGAKVLEEAVKVNPDNQSILEQLKNIYGALGDNDNFLRVKKMLEE